MTKNITKEEHDAWVAKIREESPDYVVLRESPPKDIQCTEELLGIKQGTLDDFDLRFKKGGERCTKCGRHFNVLDLFNTALKIHSKEFLLGVLNDTSYTHSDNARANYQYSGLPRGPVFRYLILKPGRGNDVLECSLRSQSLDDPPDYEAISYVWGPSVRDHTILCDGGHLKITQSLSNVLKRLRLESKARALWADSICINQEDVKEKGQQVALMAQIYGSSKQTLIYLGDDDKGHGNSAVELIEDVNTRILQTCKRNNEPWALFPPLDRHDPILSDTRWSSIAALYSSTWFGRGWVVQEAALASKSLAIWGKYEIHWAKLMRFDVWATFLAPSCVQTYEFGIAGLFSHNYFCRNQHEASFFWQSEARLPVVRVLNTLESARVLGLTDPRDRIYAFLGLVSMDAEGSDSAWKLQPNYEQDFLQVYKDFAVEYVVKKRSVELLDYVQHTEHTLDAGLPSWTPRWDTQLEGRSRLHFPYEPALTDRGSAIHRPSVAGTKLHVRAVVLDSVVYVSDVFGPHISLDDIAKVWDACVRIDAPTPYPPLCRLHAFIETLLGNPLLTNAEDARRSQAAYLLQLHQRTDEVEAIDTRYWEATAQGGDEHSYHSSLQWSLNGKRIFLTRRGYFGHAYAVAQGDQCGIVFGCKAPCILRSATGDNSYQLLGGAHITGAAPQIIQGKFQGFVMLGGMSSKDWATRGHGFVHAVP
ncbi:hypothetical protein MY11210_007537 [Beauveria gryllotalpidicola]